MKAFEAKDDAPMGADPATARPEAAPRRRSRSLIVVVSIVGLGFTLALGARVKEATTKRAALAQERANAQAAAAQKPVSKTARPEAVRYRPTVEVTGSLQPWRSADIGFELGGRLLKLNVGVGDTVKTGTILAVLDGKSAAAQVSQTLASARAAEASLAMAEDNLRRSEALVQSKAIPEAQAEQSRQQVALARAQLEASRATAQLAQSGAGDRSIKAPFDGLITKAPTSAGGVVSPGVILMRIEDHSRFRLSATLAEDDAVLVRPGAAVKVVMRDRTVDGKVTTIVPSLDQGARRVP
jgi:RND family efflux transporter MFP subunit